MPYAIEDRGYLHAYASFCNYDDYLIAYIIIRRMTQMSLL